MCYTITSSSYFKVAGLPVLVVLYCTIPPTVTKRVTPTVAFSRKLSTKSTAEAVPAICNTPLRLAVSLVIRYFMFTAYSLARSSVIPVAVNVDMLSASVSLTNAL